MQSNDITIFWQDAVNAYMPPFQCFPSDTPVSREYEIFVSCRKAGFVGEDNVCKLSSRLAQNLSRIDILVEVGMPLRLLSAGSSDSVTLPPVCLPYSLLKDMKDGESRIISLDGQPTKLTANQRLQGETLTPTFEEAVHLVEVEGIKYLADTPSEFNFPLEMRIADVNSAIINGYIIKGLTDRPNHHQESVPELEAPNYEPPRRCC